MIVGSYCNRFLILLLVLRLVLLLGYFSLSNPFPMFFYRQKLLVTTLSSTLGIYPSTLFQLEEYEER